MLPSYDFLGSLCTGGIDAFLHSIMMGMGLVSTSQNSNYNHLSFRAIKKCKATHSLEKVMSSVFCDHKVILLVDFTPKVTTIIVGANCNTLMKV